MQPYYPQQAVATTKTTKTRTGSAFGVAILWGILCALPLICIQFCLRFFPRLEALFILRPASTANGAGEGTLLLLLGLFALVSSFFAALAVARSTGRLAPAFGAGVLTRLLSGMTGFYAVWAAWQDILATYGRPTVDYAARQAIGRTLIDEFVSLLFCAGAAFIGAWVGRRRATPDANTPLAQVAPFMPSAAYPALPQPSMALPPTPTPHGWQFTPYEPSQSNPYRSPRPQSEWQYGQNSPNHAQNMPYVPQTPQVSPATSGDAPTILTADNAPTQLSQEGRSLPLPYATPEPQSWP